MEQFKYLGTTLTNQKSIQEEIKSRLQSDNAGYHSVQYIDVEYIYGFVGWGGLHAKSMTSQRYRATYKMADMRYYGNVMTTTRWRLYVILHLQQYSRRLNLFCYFFFVFQFAIQKFKDQYIQIYRNSGCCFVCV